MTKYKVYNARYPATHLRAKDKRGRLVPIPMGELDERSALSKSINRKLEELGEGWKVVSISTAGALEDIVFTVLFEKS